MRTKTRLIQLFQSTRGNRSVARRDWRVEAACDANSHIRIIAEIRELRGAGKLQARSGDDPALVVTFLVARNGIGTDRTALEPPPMAKASSAAGYCTSTFYPLLETSLRSERSLREATFCPANVLTNFYRSPVPAGTGFSLLRATTARRSRNGRSHTRHTCRSGWPRTVI